MDNHIAKQEIQEGGCPMCGDMLNYGDSGTQDDYRWYDVACPKCLWEGRQWERVIFEGYTVQDENDETRNVEPSDGTLGPASTRQAALEACKRLGMDISDGKPQVLITVEGGLVQGVQKTDPQIRVIVRDYDVEGTDKDDPRISQDPQGNDCCESEW